jgi:hypothetical protein
MVAKSCSHTQKTTTNTHTTHNNQHEQLAAAPLSKGFALSPWIGQWRPQIIAPLLPMGLLQASSAGFAHATAGSLVWDKF